MGNEKLIESDSNVTLTSISPTSIAKMERNIVADPVMQKVAHFITSGWPATFLDYTPRGASIISSQR